MPPSRPVLLENLFSLGACVTKQGRMCEKERESIFTVPLILAPMRVPCFSFLADSDLTMAVEPVAALEISISVNTDSTLRANRIPCWPLGKSCLCPIPLECPMS